MELKELEKQLNKDIYNLMETIKKVPYGYKINFESCLSPEYPNKFLIIETINMEKCKENNREKIN